MLMIRLSRVGRRNAPAFRMVVQEKSRAPQSKHIEIVGSYIPYRHPKVVQLKADRIAYWLSKGAQASDTVHNLLVTQGVLKEKKVSVTSITKKRATRLDTKKSKTETPPVKTPSTETASETPAA